MSRAKTRLLMLAGGIVFLATLLGFRLFELQVVQADGLRLERTRNLHGVEWLHAARGKILDARGRVLAEDESKFLLSFVYRDFRRAHAMGLVLHADRFLRDLSEVEVGLAAPRGLLRGAPLRYVDAAARFEAAALGALALPMSLLHRRGPLPKRLRSVLRFYVFKILSGATTVARAAIDLGRHFDEKYLEPGPEPIGQLLAAHFYPRADRAAQSLREEVLDWLRAQQADLNEIASLLSPRLSLPGSTVRVARGYISERGSLLEWLDACDRLHARRAERKYERYREHSSDVGPSFWARVADALFPSDAAPTDRAPSLTRRLANALAAGSSKGKDATAFELRMAMRFRSESGPVLVQKPVDFADVVALVLGKRERFPGFEVEEELQRRFPVRDLGGRPYRILGLTQRRELAEDDEARPSIVLGDELDLDVDGTKRLHLADDEREVWKVQIRERLLREYRVREGRNNLELKLDAVLTGRAGWRALLRDRSGRERYSPSHVAAHRGKDVRVTIDTEVQDLLLAALRRAGEDMIAERELAPEDLRASFTVIDAVDGDILGMSWIPETYRNDVLELDIPDRKNPNCEHRWEPPPGSILKPIFAVEGQLTGDVDSGEYEVCRGHFGSGWNRVSCDCRGRWKPQTLEDAVKNSCNSYFGQLGRRLTVVGLQRALQRFGLLSGTENRIHVPGLRIDLPGHVPDERRSLLARSIGYGWRTPPILIARAYAALGTGALPPLRLVDAVDGRVLVREKSTPLDVGDALRRVRIGMVAVPRDGTARRAGLQGDRIAAKTGTAEVSGNKNNAWFAGYLPWDRPRLAFCVTFWKCPEGVHGGDYPADAVRYFLRSLDAKPALRARLFRGAR